MLAYGESPDYLVPRSRATASTRRPAPSRAWPAPTTASPTTATATREPVPARTAAAWRTPRAITISADGRSLYATSYPVDANSTNGGVAAFAVDSATGKLTQLAGKDGRFTQDGSSLDGADTCTDIDSEGGSYRLALSPDQAFAYLPSAADGTTARSRSSRARRCRSAPP